MDLNVRVLRRDRLGGHIRCIMGSVPAPIVCDGHAQTLLASRQVYRGSVAARWPADITLRITIGMGLAGRSASVIKIGRAHV